MCVYVCLFTGFVCARFYVVRVLITISVAITLAFWKALSPDVPYMCNVKQHVHSHSPCVSMVGPSIWLCWYSSLSFSSSLARSLSFPFQVPLRFTNEKFISDKYRDENQRCFRAISHHYHHHRVDVKIGSIGGIYKSVNVLMVPEHISIYWCNCSPAQGEN